MVNVRNVQANDSFLQGLFWKSSGNFFSLKFFHDKNSVCPINLFRSNRSFVIESCRFGLKSIFEQFFCSFASVLVLIADKECFHSFIFNFLCNLNIFIKTSGGN